MEPLKDCICRQVPWGECVGDGTKDGSCPAESRGGKSRNECNPSNPSLWKSYDDFKGDHLGDCNECDHSGNIPPSMCSKDCRTSNDNTGFELRKVHNIINRSAADIFYATRELCKSKDIVDNGMDTVNWAKKTTTTAKNIKNVQLLNKQDTLYTKRRLLLYDEKNDRIYRVVILILKTILLIVSLIVIKFLLND